MDYIIREEIPSVETYRHIRVSAGLSDKTEQAAKTGLRNGLYSVVVCHQDAPVGMGRVIGDGGCFFVITDIAVLPQHHKKGVGDRIMTALMAWIARHAPPSAYISLIASHGSPGFYARYGFEPALLPETCGHVFANPGIKMKKGTSASPCYQASFRMIMPSNNSTSPAQPLRLSR